MDFIPQLADVYPVAGIYTCIDVYPVAGIYPCAYIWPGANSRSDVFKRTFRHKFCRAQPVFAGLFFGCTGELRALFISDKALIPCF